MRKMLIFSFLSILPMINCWKPITSSHPASFSIQQSFPANSEFTRKSSNEISSSDSVDSYIESYHRNEFPSGESALRLSDAPSGGERVLSAKSLHYDTSSKFNGIFPPSHTHDVSKCCSFSFLTLNHDLISFCVCRIIMNKVIIKVRSN